MHWALQTKLTWDIHPCVPLAIKTIMIVLFEILTLFRFKAIRSSWLTLNEIMIVLIAKGTQGISKGTKKVEQNKTTNHNSPGCTNDPPSSLQFALNPISTLLNGSETKINRTLLDDDL